MNSLKMLQGLLIAVLLSMHCLAFGQSPGRNKGFSEKQLAQQQRMTDCNVDAKEQGLSGADRKAFLKSCLSGGSVTVEVGQVKATAAADRSAAKRRQRAECAAEVERLSEQGAVNEREVERCVNR